ncbi:MAG: DUF808 family protein [Chitinophagales bacterium]
MGASIFTVLDDIAVLMDDVAITAKVATKKTAAILGDDLAVNAEKATGYVSSRELPVLWAISKGSFINKLIIVPLVLVLNVYAPFLIKILLVIGGIYLAYEGAEKIVEYLFHRNHKEVASSLTLEEKTAEALEKKKVNAAIKTDFILSLEIVIIALSSVLNENLTLQIMTVSIVALIATVGVYGFVALLVRMDDLGFQLMNISENNKFLTILGNGLVNALPLIVKLLSIVGTIALILVSGGIFIHYIDVFHHLLPKIPIVIREIIFGLGVGIISVIIVNLLKWVIKQIRNK